jgi:hypothetical protein
MSAANLPMKKNQNTKGAFGHRRSNKPLPMVSPTEAFEIPEDIKTDIATVVRSVDWQTVVPQAGLCFFRAVTGWLVLTDLGIPAMPTLGGMVYRCGPDEERDTLAFCGARNAGCVLDRHFLGHYWILSGNDFVDFSVGDWRKNSISLPDYCPPGVPKLDPIQWTVPDPPDFFWAHEDTFKASGLTPELGKAWYTGFRADSRTRHEFTEMINDLLPTLKKCRDGHLLKAYEYYALKERLFAAREGHTAVRFSQLAKLIGDADRIARSREYEKLFVLRGKQEITTDVALEILEEAGL